MNEEQTQQPVAGEGRPFADRVTEMSRQELQRRVLTQRDYIARYQRCIDGLGLSGPDGHRLPGDITAAVREMWLAEGAAADNGERESHAEPRSSAAPGSAALVNCNDRVQIRSGLPGGGVVMVRMQTIRSTGTTQLLEMGEAAWLAVELAKAIEQAMPPNIVLSNAGVHNS